MSYDVRVQVPSLAPTDSQTEYGCARVVELADSLDSGSSARYGRAGSTPASRTMGESLWDSPIFNNLQILF